MKGGNLMLWSKTLGSVILVAVSVLFTSCVSSTSTNIVQSWKDPTARPIEFKKVMFFYLEKDRTVRGFAEEEFVRKVKGTTVVPSLALFAEVAPKDVDKMKDRLRSQGFDGGVLMRIAHVDEVTHQKEGSLPSYQTTFGSYFTYWNYVPGYPGKVEKDRTIRVETVVYSLDEDKLVWAGISETENPEGIKNLVAEVIDAVAKSLREKGLLK
jgi:hypothetical protein